MEPEGERLASLDLRGLPALETLDVAGAALTDLDVSVNTFLRCLHCEANPIEALDLATTRLEMLDARGTRLTKLSLSNQRSLDVTGSPKLGKLDITGCRLATIGCTEVQKRTIPALREFFKLGKSTRDPAKMDPYSLHAFIQDHEWGNSD